MSLQRVVRSTAALTVAGGALVVGLPASAALAAPTGQQVRLTSSSCSASLVPGASGPCVARLQTLLNQRMGANLPVVGTYGKYTRYWVVKWQQQHGLTAAGVVGPATKASLEGGVPVRQAKPGKLSRTATRPVASRHTASSPAASVDAEIASQARMVVSSTPYPYVWGGGHGVKPGPTYGGLDCSGFTRWVVTRAVGRDILGQSTAAMQQRASVRTSNPKPGNLVFFTNTKTGNTHHVAVYLGNGQIAHAPRPGRTVTYGTVAGTTSRTDVVSYGQLRTRG